MKAWHWFAATLVTTSFGASACSSDEDRAPSSPAGQGGTMAGQGTGVTAGQGSGATAGRGGTSEAGRAGTATAGMPPIPEAGAAGATFTGKQGNCGFEHPAFCDTFEAGPSPLSRSGELDPTRWSVVRAVPSAHAALDDGYAIGPALMPACRPGIEGTRALPDADTLICEPTEAIATRHFLGAVAAQNYGLNTYRIRQPFDFTGRVGTIKLDVDLSGGGLYGWPAVAISEDPSPAPSYDAERGSGTQNGVQIDFTLGWCSTPDTKIPRFYSSRDYVETDHDFSWDCDQAHAITKMGSLNHVEIRVSKSGLEVWASDASADGVTFTNLQRIGTLALELPFERGYVSLITRNHATYKYWWGASWATRWDNVGFDGPVLRDTREYGAPEPLGVKQGIPGCEQGGECVWRGQVIAEHPDDGALCATDCQAEGENRTVGWVVPNEGEEEAPVAVEIPGVELDGVTGARLIWAADYPYFSWNDVFPPVTTLNLRYRVNGGPFHDRFVTGSEANAFLGDEAGAGLVNQVTTIDPAELVEGTNVIEFAGQGTWTGLYRMAVVGVDLVLDLEP